MAGRFPGAKNLREFWGNLERGVESITFLSDKELLDAGVEEGLLQHSDYVKCAGGVLDDKADFDASLFGYTPREAEIMDPQVRIFHECVYEALNDAGYDSDSYRGLIGLFAGASSNFDWQGQVILSGKSEKVGQFEATSLSNKDLLTTHVAYKLNLKGPTVNVQTTCSTSLVAIHMACQALINGECDMALAGGVSAQPGSKTGYLHQEGMIRSRDGHCRAFDAAASGTIAGEGAGVVLLKLLEEAIDDGDHIHAIVKGSAVNNDGSRKIGYTAPSIEGQRDVIKQAHEVSEIEPESITYVETHGTGTELGDPIEIEALKMAFSTSRTGFCRIGSVKTNIGHLDAAAGVAGFIKTVLALQNKKIPASLNFSKPNPKIGLTNSPFVVNNSLTKWRNDGFSLRAGVSSFGIGGTNAHIVLEETPPEAVASPTSRDESAAQLLLLSAHTEGALNRASLRLAQHIESGQCTDLRNLAYTLHVGRKSLQHRQAFVTNLAEAAAPLKDAENHAFRQICKTENKPVVFMFPGQGAQHADMALGLYREQKVFREHLDECLAVLHEHGRQEMKVVLFPGVDGDTDIISQTAFTQPLLFAVEYALAMNLLHLGIRPYAMIGHSVGEYVAACISGVLSFGDALRLLALRGSLIQQLPPGQMVSVASHARDIESLLDGLSIAAVNGPENTVVSGTEGAIASFGARLTAREINFRKLRTSHAFHSEMLDDILDEFEVAVAQIELSEPEIPFVSNLTGTWISVEQAKSSSYWRDHMRQTVRFADGLSTLAGAAESICIEVGPGRSLSALVRGAPPLRGRLTPVEMMRRVKEQDDDNLVFLGQLGRLWLNGVSPDWEALHQGRKCCRVPTPPYPFERQTFAIDFDASQLKDRYLAIISGDDKLAYDDWFSAPSWRRSPKLAVTKDTQRLLVLAEDNPMTDAILDRLNGFGNEVIRVRRGEKFEKRVEAEYLIRPDNTEDYLELLNDLNDEAGVPARIINLWLTDELSGVDTQRTGFDSIVSLSKALDQVSDSEHIIVLVSSDMFEVCGDAEIQPEKATVLGPLLVVPQELPLITCRHIDLHRQGNNFQQTKLVDSIVGDILSASPENNIAYRGGHRWLRSFAAFPEPPSQTQANAFRQGGTYLITGGLGNMGLALAEQLLGLYGANVVLTGRSGLPERSEWQNLMSATSARDLTSMRVQRILELEKKGGRLLTIKADAGSFEEMAEVFDVVEREFGVPDGVFHLAGNVQNNEARHLILDLLPSHVTDQFGPKIDGVKNLARIVATRDIGFCFLSSSLTAILGGFSFGAYAGANGFMDAFANAQPEAGTRWISANFDGWEFRPENGFDAGVAEPAMLARQGVQAILDIVNSSYSGQIVVSTTHLASRIVRWATPNTSKETENESNGNLDVAHDRPELSVRFVPPENQTQEQVCGIWSEVLGFGNIGTLDDFFELGGDSLKAMTVIGKIRKQLRASISVTDFFASPNVVGLAETIARSRTTKLPDIPKTPARNHYPLSTIQKGIYFVQQLTPTSTSFNINKVLVLNGAVDVMRLQESFRKLIARHDTFRTRITLVDGEPVQIVEDDVEFQIKKLELSDVGVPDAVKKFIRPFDLHKAPLLRVSLIKLAAEKHILMLDMHHLISDAVSDQIVIDDVTVFYDGRELAPLKLQYIDYVAWLESDEVAATFQTQERWWLGNLKMPLPVMELPTDFPRPEVQSHDGDDVVFFVEGELYGQVKNLLAASETTLYMFLIAMTNVLLARYTGLDDIIVGSEVAGRRHPDLEKVVGVFVNLLPIRNDLADNQTFMQFLQAVKSNALVAFENQDYPFERLVTKLNLGGDYSRNPLFCVVVGVDNAYKSKKAQNGNAGILSVESYPYERKTSLRDLRIAAIDLDDRIVFSITFATALFRSETVEKMAGRLRSIIQQVVAEPETELDAIQFEYEFVRASSSREQDDYGFDF